MPGSALLSRGVIASHLHQGLLPPDDRAVFRILALRHLGGDSEPAKYRLAVVDVDKGQESRPENKFNNGVICMTKDGQVVPTKDDIVDFRNGNNATRRNQMVEKDGRTVWLVYNYRIVDSTMPDGPVRQPSTPLGALKASAALTLSPPRPPRKRTAGELAHSKDASPSTASTSTASDVASRGVKRSLFGSGQTTFVPPTRATHKIKDLNPYVTKYSIQARVVDKGELKNISTSRWQGNVFNVTLQDDSGDIRATGFNEFANKFHGLLEEDKFYFLSNAQVKAIRDRRYNNTSHDFELNLNQNTTALECRNHGPVNWPKTSYSFVTVADIERKDEKSIVDFLGWCSFMKGITEVTTRDGRQVKKRDITLMDNTGSQISLTLWAEKAENFDAINKVVAVKSATVSDFNGKSLSLSFKGSFEVEPEMDEVKRLLTDLRNNQGVACQGGQSSSSSRPSDRDPIVSVAEIKVSLPMSDQAKHYYVDAYLTKINSVDLIYRACPTDQCNKKLVVDTDGTLKCNKCNTRTTSCSYRYLLRGMIADATDYAWITAFDEAATSIFGESASKMMDWKENAPETFYAHLKSVEFTRFKFRLSCKFETYNDEKRIKVMVVSAEKIDAAGAGHIARIQKQVEELKFSV